MQEKTAYTGIMYLTRARILSGEDRDKLVKVSWGGVKKLELRPEDCRLPEPGWNCCCSWISTGSVVGPDALPAVNCRKA